MRGDKKVGKIPHKVINNLSTVKTQNDVIQVNLVKWGNNPPKYDIRKWSFDGQPLKGFTLSEKELIELFNDLKRCLDEDEEKVEEKLKEEKEEIDFRKFVIHSDMSECHRKGHEYEEINSRIYVYSQAHGMQAYIICAYYCMDCKAYYINESTYQALKKRGQLMCQVFTPKTYEQYKEESFFGENLKPESILHIAGYNVGQKDNLSEEVRHKILEYVIESGLMTKGEIVFLLGKFIETRERMPYLEIAVSKWRADRDWLRGYSSTGKRLVGISYIVDETSK